MSKDNLSKQKLKALNLFKYFTGSLLPVLRRLKSAHLSPFPACAAADVASFLIALPIVRLVLNMFRFSNVGLVLNLFTFSKARLVLNMFRFSNVGLVLNIFTFSKALLVLNMFNFSNRDLASSARCRPAFADRRVILGRKSNCVILLLAVILCAKNLYVKNMIKNFWTLDQT